MSQRKQKPQDLFLVLLGVIVLIAATTFVLQNAGKSNVLTSVLESEDESESEEDGSQEDESQEDESQEDGFHPYTGEPRPKVEYEDDVSDEYDESANPFSDMDMKDLTGRAAFELFLRSVIEGFPDGTFRGGNLVNRAEAAKFLLIARFGSVEERTNDNLFSDVEGDPWYLRYIMRAAELGIINGHPDGTFRPGDPVNTAEFLKMLSKTFDVRAGSSHAYVDVPPDAWYNIYAGAAQRFGLFPNRAGGKLEPEKQLTRDEVAVAIYQFLLNRRTHDLGDAPDPTYPSLKRSNGARHADTSVVWFGQSVTQENDALVTDRDLFDDGLESISPIMVRVNSNATMPEADTRYYINILIDRDNYGKWEPFEDKWVVRNQVWRVGDPTLVTVLDPDGNTVSWDPAKEGWLRMTITKELLKNWNGSWPTDFAVGETEDYLSFEPVEEIPPTVPPGQPPTPTLPVPPVPGDWVITELPGPANGSRVSSTRLAVDSNNRPHIVYFDAEDGSLRYTRFDGTEWTAGEVIADASESVNSFATLALDSNDNPHVAYAVLPPTSLSSIMYATRQNGEWTSEVVESDLVEPPQPWRTARTISAFEPDIAVSGGRIFISYGRTDSIVDEGQQNLIVESKSIGETRWQGGGTADGLAPTGLSAKIAADPFGGVGIAYVSNNNSVPNQWGLRYAATGTTISFEPGFNTSLIDPALDVARPSVAIGPQGTAYVSYIYFDGGQFMFASRTGRTWLLEEIESTSGFGGVSSVAVNADGNPCVLYSDEANVDILFRCKTAAGWTPAELVDPEAAGIPLSLAFDSEGNAHASYGNITGGVFTDVKYATLPAGR